MERMNRKNSTDLAQHSSNMDEVRPLPIPGKRFQAIELIEYF
jgi:hypothetical protein